MSTDVIVAIIAGCCTIIGVVITSLVSARKTNSDVISKLDKAQALTEEKIAELTREVRKHNNFAEKIPAQEERIKALERDVKELKRGDKHESKTD